MITYKLISITSSRQHLSGATDQKFPSIPETLVSDKLLYQLYFPVGEVDPSNDGDHPDDMPGKKLLIVRQTP